MLRYMILLLAMTGQAFAQERPDLTRFKAFGDGLIGEWAVDIRDFDENGEVSWSATQRRIFEYKIANEFIEERTYFTSQSTGKDVDVSLHVYGYDPKQNILSVDGYWGGSPGRLFAVTTSLDDENRQAIGEMQLRMKDGSIVTHRYVLGWISDESFTHRAYETTADGREFLTEELIYRRPG